MIHVNGSGPLDIIKPTEFVYAEENYPKAACVCALASERAGIPSP